MTDKEKKALFLEMLQNMTKEDVLLEYNAAQYMKQHGRLYDTLKIRDDIKKFAKRL